MLVERVEWDTAEVADGAALAVVLNNRASYAPTKSNPVDDAYRSDGAIEMPAGSWRLCEIVPIVAGKLAGGYLVLFNRKVE